MSSISLYEPIKAGYQDKKKQKALISKGYVRDNALSNDNEQVYYNPSNKKLLVNITGTHNISDIGTDLYLAAGKLKDTDRYKEGKKVLEKAKRKYGVNKATITGHSLGGQIANYVASSEDKVTTLDPGYTIGQKARKNVKNYRTKGDWVSLFSPYGNTTTLKNPNKPSRLGIVYDGLQAHNVDNIKNDPIIIDTDHTKQRRDLRPPHFV